MRADRFRPRQVGPDREGVVEKPGPAWSNPHSSIGFDLPHRSESFTVVILVSEPTEEGGFDGIHFHPPMESTTHRHSLRADTAFRCCAATKSRPLHPVKSQNGFRLEAGMTTKSRNRAEARAWGCRKPSSPGTDHHRKVRRDRPLCLSDTAVRPRIFLIDRNDDQKRRAKPSSRIGWRSLGASFPRRAFATAPGRADRTGRRGRASPTQTAVPAAAPAALGSPDIAVLFVLSID